MVNCHLFTHETGEKVSLRLEALVFEDREKADYPQKNKGENQQQTQPAHVKLS